MSNGWSVRSKGRPYFAFIQSDASGMNVDSHPPGERAPFRVALEVAIDAMPIQNASAGEYHRLFAYQGYTTGGVVSDLLSLAITPSGRLVGLTPNGGVTQSVPGVISADGVTRELALEFNVAGQFATIFIDGTEIVFANPVPNVYPLPSYIGQIMLLNSAEALTRCACTLRKVSYVEQYRSITWAIDDGFNRVLKAVTVVEDPGIQFNAHFDLTATILDPGAASPWGPWPGDDDLNDAYAWFVSTAYARVAPPVTVYERTQA